MAETDMNIKLVHDITLLIKNTINENKEMDLTNIIREITKNPSILGCKEYIPYRIFNLLGERFILISPNLYNQDKNSLCFFIRLKSDYYQMIFKKGTGVIVSLRKFTVREHNRLYEINKIVVKENYINIVPTYNSFAFNKNYETENCIIYTKLKSF
jgi:hypothetical protein